MSHPNYPHPPQSGPSAPPIPFTSFPVQVEPALRTGL
jgi:hypothetical protein